MKFSAKPVRKLNDMLVGHEFTNCYLHKIIADLNNQPPIRK